MKELRIGLIGDTHGKLPDPSHWPALDIFAHLGDHGPNFKNDKNLDVDIQRKWSKNLFCPWLKAINASLKLVLDGNHDFYSWQHPGEFTDLLSTVEVKHVPEQAFRAFGLKVYTSSWTYYPAEHIKYDWAYGRKLESELEQDFRKIPHDTQILLTHTPQYGILDNGTRNKDTGEYLHIGSKALRDRMNDLNDLRLHAFGHEHYNGGSVLYTPDFNIKVVNAACNFTVVTLKI